MPSWEIWRNLHCKIENMTRFKTPNRSFSTRLSLWFTGCSAAFFLLAMGVSLYFVYQKIKQDTIAISRHSSQVYVDEISKSFKIAEVAARNVTPAVMQFLNTPDSLTNLLLPILKYNEELYGAAVVIEPSFFKDRKSVVAPYVVRSGGKDKYSIRNVDEFWNEGWYEDSKRIGKPHWTKVFYGKVGRAQMTDYLIPLYDNEHKFIGVFGVDVSLEWVGAMLERQKLYKNSFIQVVDEDGKEVVSKGNPLPHDKSYTFSAPIENLNWILSVTFAEKDVMKPVRILRDILLLLFVFGLVGLLIASKMIVDRLAKPVIRFARAADEISNGNFNTELPRVDTHDELMLLRDSLDDMQHELATFIEDIKENAQLQARLENELQIASSIQMNMLPKSFPDTIYALLKPAREVGGDLFDLLWKGDDLYFIIGDVSGKGIPASLMMAVTTKVFRNVAYHVNHPARIVTSLNHSLSENNKTCVFVTLFVGMLNQKTGLLTYCNAGHNPPILIHKGKANYMQVNTNIPAGPLREFPFEEQELQLAKGDRILLYTDGVTEAKNVEGEFYTENRLITVSEQSVKETPKVQVEVILREIEDFAASAEQSDDITLLNIEI